MSPRGIRGTSIFPVLGGTPRADLLYLLNICNAAPAKWTGRLCFTGIRTVWGIGMAHASNLGRGVADGSQPFVPNTSITSVGEVSPTQRQVIQRPPLESLGLAGEGKVNDAVRYRI